MRDGEKGHMKVINLDRFRASQTVSLCGAEYDVFGITVRQFLEDGAEGRGFDSVQEQFEYFIDRLERSSNIPREVLLDQEPNMLVALLKVTQGTDPNQEEEPPEDSPEKK